MSKVRLGVIGCGVIGTRHLEAAAASPRISIVAVADTDETRARSTADRFAARWYPHGDALLLDPNVDAVVLALATAHRVHLALRALRAGKHLLIEKPPGMNSAEVQQMIAIRAERIVACCSSRFRCYESARVATRFLASNPLGPIRLVRMRAIKPAGPRPELAPPPWRLSRAANGGGILVNWGIYDLDYMLGLLGWRLRPRTVLAQAWPVPPAFASHVAPGSDAECHFSALIRCDDSAAISFERGEYMPAAVDEAWQIVGEAGSLRLNMMPGRNRILHDAADSEKGIVTRCIWEGQEEYAVVHDGPVLDFADAILDARPPASTLEHALLIQRVIDAIYASAETGRCVGVA